MTFPPMLGFLETAETICDEQPDKRELIISVLNSERMEAIAHTVASYGLKLSKVPHWCSGGLKLTFSEDADYVLARMLFEGI